MTKPRIPLMACRMKLGALPVARDPAHPTIAGISAAAEKTATYQAIFDTH